MAGAPAHTTTESDPTQSGRTKRGGNAENDTGQPQRPVRHTAIPFLSRAGTVAVMALALLVGANLLLQPDWASHAQIRNKPPGFADVVDMVRPAVISVRVKIDAGRRSRESRAPNAPSDPLSRRLGQSIPPGSRSSSRGHTFLTGQGAGFFVSSDGYAVTNFHVVDKAETVEVTLNDGRVFIAKVIGTDERSDIALVKVDGAGGLPYVTFAEDTPRIGDWVIAVGNPFGLGGTVTAGIVSARDRDIGAGPYDDFLQIDAAVNRGNSGGPTFDTDGNVVGVNTAIVSPTGGSVGIAFAIPAATVKGVVAQLKDSGKVTRGWIGVQLQEVTPDLADSFGLSGTRGALIAESEPGSPAAKGGIESGDVIVSINGNEARDARDVARTISNLRPGAAAAIGVIRKGEEKNFDVTLGNMPDQREANANSEMPRQKGSSLPRLGVSVAPVSDGVAITSLEPDGPAAELGLSSGDVILHADGRKITGVGDLRATVEAAQKAGKHAVLMQVRTADGIKYVAVRFNRG
jgi:serine protease Do